MKKLTKYWINLVIVLFSIQSVFAHTIPGPGDDLSDAIGRKAWNQHLESHNVSSTNTPGIFEIPNPLKLDRIEDVISSVGKYLVGISAALLTVMILWGAFLLMTSGGNEDRVGKGKKTIYWAVLGFGILVLASGLAPLIADILGGTKGVGTNVNINGGIPIGGFAGVQGIIVRIAQWMFGILIGLGIIMVLYSAFLYMFSGGASDKIDTARKTLTYAIVALAIGVLSGSIGVLIQNLLRSATGS